MKYTEEEMILHSDSGYCMPFEAPQGEDVELSLGYGEQTHPETGEQFFHHGIDFPVRYRMLAALGHGIVRLAASCRVWAATPCTASARRSATGSTR